ncbi:MAG: uroporphyrinogen-III C-methyltransferase [Kofleriaceae bacterium]|nr:uroporphyrinogen-III C-methyltransferase [Kofleriaceae bacterium]
MSTAGTVVLVGAGPGAADLLTVRAARALASADIIFYDALVCEELLALAPNAATCFVGKRAGRPSMSQETIIRLLIRAARRGQRVVRLKSGDPFVFGRGGEEALALARAGIRYEVVPGVSSAIAAPAAAGIPVTHRGVASGMLVLTGEPEDTWRQVIKDLTPRTLTIVMLMGLRKRAPLAEEMIARGWEPSTPAAIVFSATSAAEARVFTTLGELPSIAFPSGTEGAPGVIVIGDVVTVAHQLEAIASELEGVA